MSTADEGNHGKTEEDISEKLIYYVRAEKFQSSKDRTEDYGVSDN